MTYLKTESQVQALKSDGIQVLGICTAFLSMGVFVQALLHYFSPTLWIQASAVLCSSVWILTISCRWWKSPYYADLLGKLGLLMTMLLSIISTGIIFYALGLMMLGRI